MKNDAVQEFVKVNDLTHADWNPRTVDELKPEHPAMRDLVESVKALGVIQPIVVWVRNVDGVRQATVIAGNRRAEAAKIAGVERVPALVYADGELTLEDAQSITRSENEVRLGVDPILDSQLIKRMLDQGMSQQEIAAKLGTSEATVCRRVKLCGLSDDFISLWRENSGKISVKALEAIAIHQNIQSELLGAVKNQLRYGTTLSHASVVEQIRRVTQKIDEDDWMFKSPIGQDLLASCKCCGNNTGNQADLFAGDFADEKDASRCEDCACYKRMCEKAKDSIIRAKVGDGVPFNVLNSTWDLPKCGGRKSKTNCVAYVAWNDWSHKIEKVVYAPSKSVLEAAEKRAKEDEKAARKAEEKVRARFSAAKKPFDDVFDYGKRDALIEAAEKTILAPYASESERETMSMVIRAALNSYCYSFDRNSILFAFPDFADELGITPDMKHEYREAEKALDAFTKAQAESDAEESDEEFEEE